MAARNRACDIRSFTRAKELDREKIQLNLHAQYAERTEPLADSQPLALAEWAGVWLLIYRTLDYSTRHEADKFLLAKTLLDSLVEKPSLYDRFARLTPGQAAWLLRMAMAGKTESRLPNHPDGQFLHQMAPALGVDVPATLQAQADKAAARQKGQEKRIAELEKKIEKLKGEAAA